MQEAEWMNDTTITKTQMQAFRDAIASSDRQGIRELITEANRIRRIIK